MAKTYSGYTESTAQNLLLDAGAFFKNYDMTTDFPVTDAAKAKLIGATSGGGEFVAEPDVRKIEVDGVKGDAKGLKAIDSWNVSIKASVIEVTVDTVKAALLGGKEATSTAPQGYTKIQAKNSLEDEDYLDNITWVGTLSGSDKPVIIQVYNALSTNGLSFKVEDKNNAVIELEFAGHYESTDLDTPPFAIFIPTIE